MPIPFVHKPNLAVAAKGSKPREPAPPTNEVAKQIAERLLPARGTTEAQLTSGSGVIAYNWDSNANTLVGTFVLGLYEGALATETGTKIEGPSGQLAGIYAEGEVSAAHPLTTVLETLANDGVFIERLRLGPLQLSHVTELVAGTINTKLADAESLAALLIRKTDGNPLFVTEFLKEIHHERLITFNPAEGRWTWDVARIEAKDMTDNVVDLMIDKLRRLPEKTRDALRLAACIGSRFDLDTLARVCQPETYPPASVAHQERANALRLAATFELLLPALDGGFLMASSELSVVSADAPLVVRNFKFLHDRVQQAAYALIDEDDRKSVHLRIARFLTAATKDEQRDAHLFSLTDQGHRGQLRLENTEGNGAMFVVTLPA